MIIYYSRSGNSKAYAEALSLQLRSRAFGLEDAKPYKKIGIVKGVTKAVFKKSSTVKLMPQLGKDKTIYLCSPVWAGNITPAVRYFLQHANLKGRKVNFIFTCSSSSIEKMKKNFEKSLKSDSYALGDVLIFICPREVDRDTQIISEHLRELTGGSRANKETD